MKIIIFKISGKRFFVKVINVVGIILYTISDENKFRNTCNENKYNSDINIDIKRWKVECIVWPRLKSVFDTPCFALWNGRAGKKKTYLRSQRKEEKDLGKVTRLRVQRMPGKSAAVRISAFMDMYDCFQNTVGKVDMWYVNRRGKKKKSGQRAGLVQNSMNSTSTRRVHAIEIPPIAQFSRIVDRATLKYRILFTNSRYFPSPLSNQVRLMTVTWTSYLNWIPRPRDRYVRTE